MLVAYTAQYDISSDVVGKFVDSTQNYLPKLFTADLYLLAKLQDSFARNLLQVHVVLK